MNYRLYVPDDFEQLYAIEEICFQPPDRFSRRYMRQAIRRADAATWIAEEEGRMAGFAIVEWDAFAGQIAAYIQTLEVLPQMRGLGVGGRLLERLESSARAAKATMIGLHVDAANDDAIRLYARRGYVYAGRQEDYYAEGRAALVYKKALAY